MTLTQTIGVVGAGTMGIGIAQACVVAGLPVVMIDLDEERIARGRDAIANGLERLAKKARLAAADSDAALGRLHGSTDYRALRTCDFIIEATTENESAKLEILGMGIQPREATRFSPPTRHRSRSPGSPTIRDIVGCGELR